MFLEFLAAEKAPVFVASIHPGMIEAAIFRKSGGHRLRPIPLDKCCLDRPFQPIFLFPKGLLGFQR